MLDEWYTVFPEIIAWIRSKTAGQQLQMFTALSQVPVPPASLQK